MNQTLEIPAPAIAVVGLNHKTSPVDIREKLALNDDQCALALTDFKQNFPDIECVILSTCNRTEIYLAGIQQDPPLEKIRLWLVNWAQLSLDAIRPFLYTYADHLAVEHLLKVASSLDSLVIGEPQIIAQTKNALRLARTAAATGKTLNRLFHCAFATSKEIYSSTSITQRRVSIAGVAVELAAQKISDLKSAQVVVIGAGEMGELIIKHLQGIGCQSVTVVNRTTNRAHHVARRYEYQSADWNALPQLTANADMIIAAATAQEHLFGPELLQNHSANPLVIIDIAIPRNFDPAVAQLDRLFLYSIDDLADIAHQNLLARQDDIELAKHIISDNIDSFMDWFGIMDIGPRIGRMRAVFHELAAGELNRFLDGEPALTITDKQKMQSLTTRLVNKVVHRLINNFHTIARDFGPEHAARLIEQVIQHPDRTDRKNSHQPRK